MSQWGWEAQLWCSPQHPQTDGWWCQWWCGCGRKWWGEPSHPAVALFSSCVNSPWKLSRQTVPRGEMALIQACSLETHPYQGKWFSAEQPSRSQLFRVQALCVHLCLDWLPLTYWLEAQHWLSCAVWEGERPPRLVFIVPLNPSCNPAVDRGHQSVLTLCSALGWQVREKARQILLSGSLYSIWEEETNGPKKIILNSRLQLLGASWVVQIVKARRISKWKKLCYCFTFWHYYSSNSREPRKQSHHVWKDLKVSINFKLNMNQQFGETAKFAKSLIVIWCISWGRRNS